MGGGGWSSPSEPVSDDSIQRTVMEHNATRLFKAAWERDRSLVEELLAAGTDANRADSQGRLALHAAVCVGDLEITRALLGGNADPGFPERTPDGGTPLQIAGWQGNHSIAKLLLEASADANAPNAKGQTPLYSAALQGHKTSVQVLLEAGADANKVTLVGTRPVTPLQAAVEGRHSEVATLLKSYGARRASMAASRGIFQRLGDQLLRACGCGCVS